MKCFISSLLGLKLSEQTTNEACKPLPPIVRSLVGGIIFLAVMLIYLCSASGQ